MGKNGKKETQEITTKKHKKMKTKKDQEQYIRKQTKTHKKTNT